MMHLCVIKVNNHCFRYGSLHVPPQVTIKTNVGILLTGPLGKKTVKFVSIHKNFDSRKCIWKSCRKMLAILSHPQCVNLAIEFMLSSLNTLRPRRNRRHFADAIFKGNFLNENVWIPIKISLTFVPKGPINNIPALVQIMAWRRTGDKPLSEPMMTQFNDAYMRHLASMS